MITQEEYLRQMENGALLNPRIDSTFKALFTSETPQSRAALKSFLEAAIEQKIREVTLTANSAPMDFVDQRQILYDIQAILDDGRIANIEMQAFNQSYDYGKRSEYHAARLVTTYFRKGKKWSEVPTVYQISILDFVYDKEDNEAIGRYSMRKGNGRKLSGTINSIFIELPKIIEKEDSLDENSSIENWAIFLKEADRPDKSTVIKRLTQKEDGLMQARNSLVEISKDMDLWIQQFREDVYETDRISGLMANREIGLEEGRKEGREQGLKEGLKKAAIELKKMGLPLEQISKATSLTIEEIQKL